MHTEDFNPDPSKVVNESLVVDDAYLDDPLAARALLRKLDLRILPILALLWFLTFMDRVNIANAKVQGMEKTLGFTGSDYNVALTVFFATFIAFEVPSNWLLGARLRWLSPAIWLGFQVFAVALFTIGQGLVTNYSGILAMRIMLGVFEAGLVPGSVLLLSNYYPKYQLQWRMSILAVANALASAFGGLIAYLITNLNEFLGRQSWEWVFIIEGTITAAAGLLGMVFIVDWPDRASFLSARELRLVRHLIEKDCKTIGRMDRLDRDAIIRCLRDWKIWINIVIYACTVATTYSINLFGPTIIQGLDKSKGASPKHVLLITAPIFLVSAVFCLASAWVSDRLHHRASVVIVGYFLSFIGFAILLAPPTAVTISIRYVAIYFVAVGSYISLPVLWSLMANNVSGIYKSAFASSMQIGFGSVGGIIASSAYRTQDAPLFIHGHWVIFSILVTAFVLVCIFVYGIFVEKNLRHAGKRDYRLTSPHLDNMGDDHPQFQLTY